MDTLLSVLRDLRARLAEPDNDFTWSSFIDQESALEELDRHMARLSAGEAPGIGLYTLFAPTGPAQEVASSSGWGNAFCAFADRFDEAARQLKT